MKLLFTFVFLITTNLGAEVESCLTTGLESIQEEANQLLQISEYPKMKMSYSVDPQCRYSVISEVVIPSTIISPEEFLRIKIMNPDVNIASADSKKVLRYDMEKEDENFRQVIRTVKNGVAVDIKSLCTKTKVFNDRASVTCKVDAGATKIKGVFKLFVDNEVTITCSNVGSGLKKCIFKTVGLANSIPLLANSCDLAAPGAAETFESTYRLAYYITHGHLGNITSGKTAVNRMYLASKNHKDLGKKQINLSEETK